MQRLVMRFQAETDRRVLRSHAAVAGIALAMVLVWAGVAGAQPPPANPDAPETTETVAHRTGLWELFLAGGWIGYTIVALSVVALSLVFEQCFTLRRRAFMPPGVAEQLHHFIANGEFAQAEQLCRQHPSFLTQLVRTGLQEVRVGYSAVEKALEEAAHYHAARLYRRIDLLSVLASIATMLGLLGTVVGLIQAFKRVAESGGAAQAADLAGGIYLALVTTVEGLLVAIPCMAFFALLRNRLDQLVAEAALLAEYSFAGYKRARLLRKVSPDPTRQPASTGG
jgi:biopolymer transport protein ExbB